MESNCGSETAITRSKNSVRLRPARVGHRRPDDPDGDPVTFALLTQPRDGSLSGTAPNLRYTPDDGFDGIDSFTYEVCDTDGLCATATVTVTVTPVNDPPVAVDDTETAGALLDGVAVVAAGAGILANTCFCSGMNSPPACIAPVLFA